MIIWRLDVNKFCYTEKRDWLKVNDELGSYSYLDDDKEENYTIFFPYFSAMSKYIDEITEGHNQYWADVYEKTDGDEESLEYHNGSKWDSEIHLTTNRVRLHDSLVEAVRGLDKVESQSD